MRKPTVDSRSSPSPWPPTTYSTTPQRDGMTLVELLVVIVILTMLVTTAIPIIAPGGETRKLREASRGINSYLQGAQSRAMQTGRPFGVALRRLSADTKNGADNAVCNQLQYVEVPPAFAGVDDSSLVRICVYQNSSSEPQRIGLHFVRYGTDFQPGADNLPTGYDADLIPELFLRPGDVVEVGSRRFVLAGPTAQGGPTFDRPQSLRPTLITIPALAGPGAYGTGSYLTGNSNNPAGYFFPIEITNLNLSSLRLTHNASGLEITSAASDPSVLFATTPVPYKIYRQPAPAGGEPLQLPSGVAIDLQASAFGNGMRLYQPADDYNESLGEFNLREEEVQILFAPEGSIHRVHGVVTRNPATGGLSVETTPVTGYVALCVGRRELIPAALPEGTAPTTQNDYREPIDLIADLNGLSETETSEITDQYNWLNLESRWVIVGGQSGAVTTIENSAVYAPSADYSGDGVVSVGEQIRAALENAPRRTTIGGR